MWGNAGHTLGPTTLSSLVEIGIAQICCAEKCFLALTKNGKVYTCQYTSEGQVRVKFFQVVLIHVIKTCFHSIIDFGATMITDCGLQTVFVGGGSLRN